MAQNNDWDINEQLCYAQVKGWIEGFSCHNSNYTTDDTLSYVKECCSEYNLDILSVKKIFDECEEPFYYVIETNEIKNSEDPDSDDDEEDV